MEEGDYIDSNLSTDELLKYALENGMIDLSYMQEKINMKKREEILKQHFEQYSIWYSEKENRWYTHLPDDTKPEKRKKIKRKDRIDLENLIYDYYLSLKEKEPPRDMSIKSIFFEFMEYKKKEVGCGTIKRMMADWERFYKPKEHFVAKNVNTITKIDIDDFFNSVLDEHQLKKKAFYNMCGLLKQMLEYCVDAEYIDKNPYRVKINKKKLIGSGKKLSCKEVYQSNEISMFMSEMERRLSVNPSNTAPLAIMLDFELGTRKGEILAISKSDIEDKRIHIHRQLIKNYDVTDVNHIKKLGYKIVEYTKTEDGDRWLPLSDKAMQLINRVISTNEKYKYQCGDLIFVKDDHYLSPDTVDGQLRRACEYINIPIKTMHKIRKTYASILLHNGVNISIVKDLLGHADESTTLKHYIYNIEEESTTEMQVLNALQAKNASPSDQSDQNNMIHFPTKKIAKTL